MKMDADQHQVCCLSLLEVAHDKKVAEIHLRA